MTTASIPHSSAAALERELQGRLLRLLCKPFGIDDLRLLLTEPVVRAEGPAPGRS